jgi:exopolyphosphatase/guanosine-5'-triphosphate,3'-diphosphate pyrophosphatase
VNFGGTSASSPAAAGAIALMRQARPDLTGFGALGVLRSTGRAVTDRTLVVDVGGGSTELVLGGPGGVEFHVSLDLGCVRLTERFLGHDPPAPLELEACSAFVRSLLERRVPAGVTPEAAIGVAGTVTTLAALDLGLDEEVSERVHRHVMTAGWIDAEVGRLAEATVAERRARPGMHPDRAPVIVAGAIVVRETLRHFGLELLEASEHDIMHGAALAAAENAE